MKVLNHHPSEIEFRKMLDEVRQFIEKYENRFVDGDEWEVLKKELTKINQRLFELQLERFSQYINDKGKVENLHEDEVALQKDMTDLQIRLKMLIGDEKNTDTA